MYRVIVIVMSALALAGCSSNADWLSIDAFKPKPPVEPVRFESTPPGATVTLPNGQTCLTPCASPFKSNGTYTVQFALSGYQPATETIAPMTMGDGTAKLQPNPVTVALTPMAPPKKVRHRRRAVHKRAVKPAPKPVPVAPTQAPSPWPPSQPPQQ
ncbi:MAG: PEGA domain-containing protein [Pseudolabrys sp.]|jgi:hypothetical protein